METKIKKVRKLLIRAFYGLDGDYIDFPDNPLHGKTYENVNVTFRQEFRTIGEIDFSTDIICIEREDPIECELLACCKKTDGTYVLDICQDWG